MFATTVEKSKRAMAAQEFLPIESIRDGLLVMKGAEGLRAVLMVSSLNFALKSEDEQDALILQYENFLNALDFPMQFVVQSRRLNIAPYLDTLSARQKEESNELIKVQIGEYAEFIKTFVDLTNIVTKTFFAIVPFTPSIIERGGGALRRIRVLLGGAAGQRPVDGDLEFAQTQNQLLQRVDAVSAALKRLGLRAAPLNTEELVELFYGLYNPMESQRMREAEPPAA